MQGVVEGYLAWYNGYRPHTALDARTPDQVFEGRAAARELPRFEPRKRYPLRRQSACTAPESVRGKRGVKLELVVSHHDDRSHLPVVELRRAA
jgi:hypothetical protein